MQLREAIHFRAPERWRGRVKSHKVRLWFRQFAQWKGELAPKDPGPGPLELSVRIPRRELKQAAKRQGISGTVLLRRLIAAQLEPQKGPKVMESQAGNISSANPFLRRPPAGAVEVSKPIQTLSPDQNARKPLSIVGAGDVPSFRALEQIGHAIRKGAPITEEELLRWRAVFLRK